MSQYGSFVKVLRDNKFKPVEKVSSNGMYFGKEAEEIAKARAIVTDSIEMFIEDNGYLIVPTSHDVIRQIIFDDNLERVNKGLPDKGRIPRAQGKVYINDDALGGLEIKQGKFNDLVRMSYDFNDQVVIRTGWSDKTYAFYKWGAEGMAKAMKGIRKDLPFREVKF